MIANCIVLLIHLLLFVGALAVGTQGVSQTLEIIQARGFAGEEYHLKTSDGYPITVYHVLNPFADPKTLNKFPVIIFHGLGGDSTQMISHSVFARARKPIIGQLTAMKGDDCLAFMLSNNNFDVWLADFRGVNLNDRNASQDTDPFKSQRFWDYTLDEQALYDAPRHIGFVLEQTQAQKAFLVTYSESTSLLFALLSAFPDYADKVAALVAMAPTVYVSNLRGLAVPWMLPFLLTPDSINGNITPQPIMDTVGMTVRRLCSIRLISMAVCKQVTKAIVGNEATNSDAADFFSTISKSSSIKVFRHYVQLHTQKRFGMYDYGPQMNLIKYSQSTAPNYDLGRVRAPTIILVRGGNDFLSSVPDQERLIRELKVKPIDIKLPSYNHIDFLVNENVLHDVIIPVAQIFAQVMLNDPSSSGTIIRNPTSAFPTPRIPDSLVKPDEKRGRIIETPTHFLRNLVDVLELRPKLDLLMVAGQKSQVTKRLDELVENADLLENSLNKIF